MISEPPRMFDAICPACETTVLTQVEQMTGMLLKTGRGDRRVWIHLPTGTVVHRCDLTRRAQVRALTGQRCENPFWLAWLWRHRRTRPLARRIQPVRDFPPMIRIEEV